MTISSTISSTIFSEHLPKNLHAEGRVVANTLFAVMSEEESLRLQAVLSSQAVLAAQLIRALLGSEYVLESCCRNPSLLLDWLLTDVPSAPLTETLIADMAEHFCRDSETTDALDKALRQLRRRLMVAIIWRDVNRLSDFTEVCQSMTAMAESVIQQALDFHFRELSVKHGTPIGIASGSPQQLLVLGMGKLGGGELNLSSDIDLIFAFPEAGETHHPKRPLDNQAFFIRLGQRVIKTLNDVTVDGFVFRVDMRLRPYGQSGALVSSFASLENYYQTQGRDWERFAAIKARVVTCSSLPDAAQSESLAREAIEGLEDILQPFTYRKYTDFSVIESLRKLKAMIAQEVRRKGMEFNVKLGAGGIRECEFITQAFQLVSGGRELALQERHWLSVLKQLEIQGVFDPSLIEKLRQAYIFLRETEHGIQAYRDQQTQQLPESPKEQKILAWVMGFEGGGSTNGGESGWQEFLSCLKKHRDCVSEQFQLVIADPDDMTDQLVSDDATMWLSLWLECGIDTVDISDQPEDEFVVFLQEQGYVDAVAVIRAITHLRDSWAVKQLSAQRRESLDTLIPQLLVIATHVERPDITVLRLLTWLGKIVGRSSYITLLVENPQALKHLADLFQDSIWIADLMAKMPALLDEMLDMVNLYTLPTKTELQNELRLRLLRIDADDVEQIMEELRYFKLSHSLRVAASELSGRLPLMKVSDYLTWIAEVVLEHVLILAWQQLSAKHGVPQHGDDNVLAAISCPESSGFIIVAYGKMGGIELSYGSDLDLVFIYDAHSESVTDGVKSIDAQTFYIRLGQKIIHILNTRSLSGPLYEVDMRLRPSGNSGLLATSMQAFSRYQHNEAWTWEHQALVRARPITGDIELAKAFVDLRKNILRQTRDITVLREDVLSMRHKMREHLGADAGSAALAKDSAQDESRGQLKETMLFHLKQDAGGIVDIEFMVQYAVLAWSHDQGDLAEYTDNIRILEQLQSSACVSDEQGSLLIDIYQAYRAVTHRLALQEQPPLLQQEQLSILFANYQLLEKKSLVEGVWKEWLLQV